MALIQETITINDKQYLHSYSDANCFVLQTDTGIQYQEATDPIDNPLNHTYVEGDPIPTEDITGDEAIAALEEIGGIVNE